MDESLRYLIAIIYLLLPFGTLKSREPEAPIYQVEFSVFCLQRPEGIKFINAEGRAESLQFYSSSRSAKYHYRGTSPIRFFREQPGSGAFDSIAVAEVWIPPSAQKLLLVFLADPRPADLQYIVYPFDDSLTNLPAGHIAIFNLSGFILRGSIDDRPVILEAGPSPSYSLQSEFINLRFGTYFGDRFRQAFSSPVMLTKDQRAILFFFPPYLKGSAEVQPRLLIHDLDDEGKAEGRNQKDEVRRQNSEGLRRKDEILPHPLPRNLIHTSDFQLPFLPSILKPIA